MKYIHVYILLLLTIVLGSCSLKFSREAGYTKNAAVRYQPFETDAGELVVDGVNLTRKGVNEVIPLINTELLPLLGLSEIDTLGMFDPQTNISVGDSSWTFTDKFIVSKEMSGANVGIGIGSSPINNKRIKSEIFLSTYPLEILGRKKWKGINFSRCIEIGIVGTVDFADPGLFGANMRYRFNLEQPLLGELWTVGVSYVSDRDFFRTSGPMRTQSLVLSTSFRLTRQRYGDKEGTIPIHIISGAFADLKVVTANTYVPFLNKILTDSHNAANKLTHTTARLVDELQERVGINVGSLSYDLEHIAYDSIPALHVKDWNMGYQVGLGFDEKFAYADIMYRKSKRYHEIQGRLGIYPTSFFLQPKKHIDWRKSLIVGVLFDHDTSIDKGYRDFVDRGIFAQGQIPVIINERTTVKASLGYTYLQYSHQSNAKKSTISASITVSHTFDNTGKLDRKRIDHQQKNHQDRTMRKIKATDDVDEKLRLLTEHEKYVRTADEKYVEGQEKNKVNAKKNRARDKQKRKKKRVRKKNRKKKKKSSSKSSKKRTSSKKKKRKKRR